VPKEFKLIKIINHRFEEKLFRLANYFDDQACILFSKHLLETMSRIDFHYPDWDICLEIVTKVRER